MNTMKTHLYLDANIYLSFYTLPKDDLDELQKLLGLIRQGNLILNLPKQTSDEFYRNRESRIATAFKIFEESKIEEHYPIFGKNYPEYKLSKN